MIEDYPKTLLELEKQFATDEQCRAYLMALRWPEGFVCPSCGGRKAWPAQRGRRICAACRHQATVTAGTIFQDSRLPLRLWCRAIWQVTRQKNGASALGLQRILGLGSYQTAWTVLHKLRRAMVRPGRDQLSGRVEVDETQVGGVTPGQKGRGIPSKALVVIAAQEFGAGIGRVRLARIPDGSTESLHPFLQGAIARGSCVHTDGWKPYQGLAQLGYSARGQQTQRPEEKCRHRITAAGASGGLLAQTLVVGNAPRCDFAGTFGLLFGRVHVPFQSPNLHLTRQTVLPPDTTSRAGAAEAVSNTRGRLE